MIRYFLATVSVILFAAASSPSGAAPPTAVPSKSTASKAVPSKADTPEIPSEINIPSSVGEVVFRHQMHIRDLGV